MTDRRREAHVKADSILAIGARRDIIGWNHPTGVATFRDGSKVKFGHVGSGDWIGARAIIIDESMIGRVIAQAVSIEFKHPTRGDQREAQERFEVAWEMRGGLYILARDTDHVIAELNNTTTVGISEEEYLSWP